MFINSIERILSINLSMRSMINSENCHSSNKIILQTPVLNVSIYILFEFMLILLYSLSILSILLS